MPSAALLDHLDEIEDVAMEVRSRIKICLYFLLFHKHKPLTYKKDPWSLNCNSNVGAIKSLPLCLEPKDPPSFLDHFIVWGTHKEKQCTAGLNKPLKPKLPKSQKMHQWTSTQLGGPFWSQELWNLTLSQSTVFFVDLSNTKDQDRVETRKRVICCPPSWSECPLPGFSAATFTTINLSSSPLCYSTYTLIAVHI